MEFSRLRNIRVSLVKDAENSRARNSGRILFRHRWHQKLKKNLTFILYKINRSWSLFNNTASEHNSISKYFWSEYILVNLYTFLIQLINIMETFPRHKIYRCIYICVHDFIFTCTALHLELPLCIHWTSWISTHITFSGTVVWSGY